MKGGAVTSSWTGRRLAEPRLNDDEGEKEVDDTPSSVFSPLAPSTSMLEEEEGEEEEEEEERLPDSLCFIER